MKQYAIYDPADADHRHAPLYQIHYKNLPTAAPHEHRVAHLNAVSAAQRPFANQVPWQFVVQLDEEKL